MAERGGRKGESPARRDVWRRRIVRVQGAYYALTGLFPLVYFDGWVRVVGFPAEPFQAHLLAAVVLVVGGSLLEAARRGLPGRQATLLAAAVAGALALVELIWLPRLAPRSGLWIDLILQVAFAISLALSFPRERDVPAGPGTRRR